MNSAAIELNTTAFNLYTLLLAISGILLLVAAGTGFGGGNAGVRTVNAVFGVLFLGYAIYLQFIFTSGTVFLSYYVFVVPVLLIVRAVRNRNAAEQASAGVQTHTSPSYPNPQQPSQPSQYGYPGQSGGPTGYPAPQQPSQYGYPGQPSDPTGYPNPQQPSHPGQYGYPGQSGGPTGYPNPQQPSHPGQYGYPAQPAGPTGYPAPQQPSQYGYPAQPSDPTAYPAPQQPSQTDTRSSRAIRPADRLAGGDLAVRHFVARDRAAAGMNRRPRLVGWMFAARQAACCR